MTLQLGRTVPYQAPGSKDGQQRLSSIWEIVCSGEPQGSAL